MDRTNRNSILLALVVLSLAGVMIALGCGKREVASASTAAIALLMTASFVRTAIRARLGAKAR
jgi:hypothetical protein